MLIDAASWSAYLEELWASKRVSSSVAKYFFILCLPNIFKLQLDNKYMLKVQTLIFNLEIFTSN